MFTGLLPQVNYIKLQSHLLPHLLPPQSLHLTVQLPSITKSAKSQTRQRLELLHVLYLLTTQPSLSCEGHTTLLCRTCTHTPTCWEVTSCFIRLTRVSLEQGTNVCMISMELERSRWLNFCTSSCISSRHFSMSGCWKNFTLPTLCFSHFSAICRRWTRVKKAMSNSVHARERRFIIFIIIIILIIFIIILLSLLALDNLTTR